MQLTVHAQCDHEGLRWKGTTFFLIITISVTTGPDVFSFSIFFFVIKGKDKLLSKVSSS